MIPELNEDGNLPEGIHTADEHECLQWFGMGSAQRKWLAARFQELLALARSTGLLERLIVWGSFVTAKEIPNDLDVLLLMSDQFRLESVPQAARPLFDHVEAKVRFHADVFWSRSSIDETVLHLWLDTYQTARDFKRRGIVEVILE